MSKITMYTGFKMILMIWVTTNFLELKIRINQVHT